MGVEIRPWDDASAAKVFCSLDPMDHLEAELALGRPVSGLGLFADWRAQPWLFGGCFLAVEAGPLTSTPFAVFGAAQSGCAGVGVAAFLARRHARWRPAIGRAGVLIRRDLGARAARQGINRLEARTWSDHPTGAGFLEVIGFRHEADLPGFGQSGNATFRQYAWIRRGE